MPTALFFWMVVCKFKVWRWPAIVAAIVGYFAALVGMSLWCHHLLADAAGTLVPADPGILVGAWEWHNGVTINTLNMEPEEVPVLVEGMITCYEKLSKGGVRA